MFPSTVVEDHAPNPVMFGNGCPAGRAGFDCNGSTSVMSSKVVGSLQPFLPPMFLAAQRPVPFAKTDSCDVLGSFCQTRPVSLSSTASSSKSERIFQREEPLILSSQLFKV